MRKGAVAWLVVLLAACGSGSGTGASGGSPSPSPSDEQATCAPAGTSLSITAKDIAFDKACLAAPAKTAFTIAFANEDEMVPHNVAILVKHDENHMDAEALFRGEIVTGPGKTTYKVDPLEPGDYTFHCDLHPDQMNGAFLVS